jgi:hypothetical protein
MLCGARHTQFARHVVLSLLEGCHARGIILSDYRPVSGILPYRYDSSNWNAARLPVSGTGTHWRPEGLGGRDPLVTSYLLQTYSPSSVGRWHCSPGRLHLLCVNRSRFLLSPQGFPQARKEARIRPSSCCRYRVGSVTRKEALPELSESLGSGATRRTPNLAWGSDPAKLGNGSNRRTPAVSYSREAEVGEFRRQAGRSCVTIGPSASTPTPPQRWLVSQRPLTARWRNVSRRTRGPRTEYVWRACVGA